MCRPRSAATCNRCSEGFAPGCRWASRPPEADIRAKPEKDSRDRFELHLSQIVINAIGEAAATNMSVQFHSVDGLEICRVHARPSGFPVEAQLTVAKDDEIIKKTAFFVRIGNGTRELDALQKAKYIVTRWQTE